jgi:hypothetical protein
VVAENDRPRSLGEARLLSDGHINGHCLGCLTPGPDRVLKQERCNECCEGGWVHD